MRTSRKSWRLASLKKEVGDLNEYKKKTEDLESKRNIINTLEIGRNGPVHLMDEFSQAMPQAIWMMNLPSREIRFR